MTLPRGTWSMTQRSAWASTPSDSWSGHQKVSRASAATAAPSSSQVRRVIERAQQPAPATEHDETADGTVVGMDERKRATVRGLPAQLADHTAVDEGRDGHPGARVADDPLDAAARPLGEGLVGLGVRDHVPALLGQHPEELGIALMAADPELAALPVTEAHLVELEQRCRIEAEALREWRGRLTRAREPRRVEGSERLTGEALGHAQRLLLADLRQGRVGVALDQLERLAGNGVLRGAVPHQND